MKVQIECVRQSKLMSDALPSYKYLYDLKDKIPKELYAYQLRKLLKYNTANVPVDFRLKMLDGIDRNDIMYQAELAAIQAFGESITIYRGAPATEEIPGLSWSRIRSIAEQSDFYRGRLFIAEIPTS